MQRDAARGPRAGRSPSSREARRKGGANSADPETTSNKNNVWLFERYRFAEWKEQQGVDPRRAEAQRQGCAQSTQGGQADLGEISTLPPAAVGEVSLLI